MNNKKAMLVFTLLFILSQGILAQQGPVSSGGEATGSGGTTSFSIGQMDFMWQQGVGGNINQGIQQPREFFTTSIPEIGNVGINAFVFPNPSTGNINISLQNTETSNIRYALFNTQGQLITEGPLAGSYTSIDLNTLTAGAYFLRLNIENKTIRIFKIIKQ